MFSFKNGSFWISISIKSRAEATSFLGSHLPTNKMGLPSSCYLVHAEGHGEPLKGGDGGELEVLFKVLVQVVQVETLVEAAVLVGDDIKQKAAVLLVGIDVMKNHHRVRVKLGGYGLPSPLVNYVNVSLKEDAHPVVSLPFCWPSAVALEKGRDPVLPCTCL